MSDTIPMSAVGAQDAAPQDAGPQDAGPAPRSGPDAAGAHSIQ